MSASRNIKIGLLASSICFSTLFFAYKVVGHVLPGILASTYKRQINQTFDIDFTPQIDRYLRGMGVSFSKQQPARCIDGPYSPSDPCGAERYDNERQLNSASASKWDTYGEKLDTYLSENGWRLEGGERYYKLSQILHSNSDSSPFYTLYTKTDNGVTCELYVSYFPELPHGKINVYEICSKYSKSPGMWLRDTI